MQLSELASLFLEVRMLLWTHLGFAATPMLDHWFWENGIGRCYGILPVHGPTVFYCLLLFVLSSQACSFHAARVAEPNDNTLLQRAQLQGLGCRGLPGMGTDTTCIPGQPHP